MLLSNFNAVHASHLMPYHPGAPIVFGREKFFTRCGHGCHRCMSNELKILSRSEHSIVYKSSGFNPPCAQYFSLPTCFNYRFMSSSTSNINHFKFQINVQEQCGRHFFALASARWHSLRHCPTASDHCVASSSLSSTSYSFVIDVACSVRFRRKALRGITRNICKSGKSIEEYFYKRPVDTHPIATYWYELEQSYPSPQ